MGPVSPTGTCLAGRTRQAVDTRRKIARLDTGMPQHLDRAGPRIEDQPREQIRTPGPLAAVPGGAIVGVRHGGGGQRRPALGAPGFAVRAFTGGHDGQCAGVLHRALPAQAVADAALYQVAEQAGELRGVAGQGAYAGVGFQERVQQMSGVDLPVPVPDGSAPGTGEHRR